MFLDPNYKRFAKIGDYLPPFGVKLQGMITHSFILNIIFCLMEPLFKTDESEAKGRMSESNLLDCCSKTRALVHRVHALPD